MSEYLVKDLLDEFVHLGTVQIALMLKPFDTSDAALNPAASFEVDRERLLLLEKRARFLDESVDRRSPHRSEALLASVGRLRHFAATLHKVTTDPSIVDSVTLLKNVLSVLQSLPDADLPASALPLGSATSTAEPVTNPSSTRRKSPQHVARLLILSDIHFGHPGSGKLLQPLENALVKDLSRHTSLRPVDAVILCGDISYSGEERQFKDFLSFVHRIMPHDPPMFSVPGNHDVNRSVLSSEMGFESNIERAKKAWEEHKPQHPGNNSDRSAIEDAFHNYNNAAIVTMPHCRSGFPGDVYGLLELAELAISFVGLNSSACHVSSGDYDGKLYMSSKQVDWLRRAVGESDLDWEEGNDLRILITHHGLDMLAPSVAEDVRTNVIPALGSNLHLFGHVHRAKFNESTERLSIDSRLYSFTMPPLISGAPVGPTQTISLDSRYTTLNIYRSDSKGLCFRVEPRIARLSGRNIAYDQDREAVKLTSTGRSFLKYF